MNTTNMLGAWSTLGGSLHLLFHRMPVADPRRMRVNTDAIAADDRGLQSIGQDDDSLEAKLLKLAGQVAVIDFTNHPAFDGLLDQVEVQLAN